MNELSDLQEVLNILELQEQLVIVLEKQEEELEELRIENQQYLEQLEELESINNSLMMQIKIIRHQ